MVKSLVSVVVVLFFLTPQAEAQSFSQAKLEVMKFKYQLNASGDQASQFAKMMHLCKEMYHVSRLEGKGNQALELAREVMEEVIYIYCRGLFSSQADGRPDLSHLKKVMQEIEYLK